MQHLYKPLMGDSLSSTRSSSAQLPAASLPMGSTGTVSLAQDEYSFVPSVSAAPTAAQLHSLMSVPSGMASAMQRSRDGKRKSRGRLVADAQVVSRLFDALGRRPQPTNGLSLEQSIQVELTIYDRQFIVTSSTAGAAVYATKIVQMSQFSAAASLLSVFDQYRIDQIEVWLEADTPNAQVIMPEMFSAVDLDDGNTPVNVGQVADHVGAIVAIGPSGHYHKWRPHVAIATFSGAFTSYANTPSIWVDSASPNVQHYGLKVAAVSNGATFGYNLVTRVVVSLRAPAIN